MKSILVVLHAQHGHDTQGLSCLLPRSGCDNPVNVLSLDGSIRCKTISCIWHNLACIRTSLRYLSRCSCSLALGVLQQARMVVHPDSALDVERGPRRALDRIQILQRRLFRHHLHCPRSDHKTVSPALDLITRPCLLRANVFFGMETFSQPRAQVPPLRHDTSWNLPSNSEYHRCPKWQEHPSILSSLQSLIRRFAITRHMAFVQDVHCVLHNLRKHRRVNRDWT